MHTGENEQALRKIMDFTRFLAVSIVILHFYFSCYSAFRELHLTHKVTDHILLNIFKFRLFRNGLLTKAVALVLLIVSLIGTKGKKDEKIPWKNNFIYAGLGLAFYFFSSLLFQFKISARSLATIYIGLTATGFLLFLSGISKMFRIINIKLENSLILTT